MANLSISSGGKAIETKGLQVRELKAGLSIEQAAEQTQSNGIDETFVAAGGKNYVIYSEDNLKLDSKASIQIDGQAAKVLKSSNEINSFGEGLAYVPKKGLELAKAAIKPFQAVVPNFATGAAITAGVLAGAISRNTIKPFVKADDLLGLVMPGGIAGGLLIGNTIAYSVTKNSALESRLVGHGVGSLFGAGLGVGAGSALNDFLGLAPKTVGIGIGLGALAGVASVTAAADTSSSSQGAKQLRAWATGAGSVALGAVSPEIVKLAAKIRIPDMAIKGAKVAGTAALVGGTMATLGLATAGALKSADTKSLDAISQ